MTYKIYTDGSSNQGNVSKENRKGGWAYLIMDDKEIIVDEQSGLEIERPTNNQCELLAVINGLKKTKELSVKGFIEVYSDSAYVVNAFEHAWIETWLKNGWKNSLGEPVVNKELWVELIDLIKTSKARFNKVKRKSNVFSKRVDELARAKMRS